MVEFKKISKRKSWKLRLLSMVCLVFVTVFVIFHTSQYFYPVPSLASALKNNDTKALGLVAKNLNRNYPLTFLSRWQAITFSLLNADFKNARVQLLMQQRNAIIGQYKNWTSLLKAAQADSRWQQQEYALTALESLKVSGKGDSSNLTEQRLQLYASQFRTGESFDELWKLVLDEKNPRALADWIAKPLLNEIDTRGLETDLKKAFENDPDFPWIRRAWGIFLWSSGRYQEAFDNLKSVESRFENDPQGRFALAESMLALGLPVDVLQIMGIAPVSSGCPDVQLSRYYLNCGRIYEVQNEPKNALEQYKHSIRANPADLEAVVRLGQLSLSNGQKFLSESCQKYANELRLKYDSIRKACNSNPDTIWNAEKYQNLAELCDSFRLPDLNDPMDHELKVLIECREFVSIYQKAAIAWRSLANIREIFEKDRDSGRVYSEIVFMARPRLVSGSSSPIKILRPIESQVESITFQDQPIPGLDYQYQSFEGQKFRIADVMGGGVAMIDFDKDGWIDLYFPNGCDFNQLSGSAITKTGNNRLFRNIQGESFKDVTTTAGVSGKGYAMGASVGDYNQDGWPDLFVTGYGLTILYKNRGDGTFEDVTSEAGVGCNLWTTASAFADLDGDGDLDLMGVTYVDAPLEGAEACVDQLNHPIHCSPGKFPAQADKLWENVGDGKFRDISQLSGIEKPENGRGLGLAVADLDQDGRLDLFVANDASPNFYFHNEGELKFREMAVEAGLAVDGAGRATASMGVVADDLNEDGLIDLFHTNFINEPNTFHKNFGGGFFVDSTLSANLSASSLSKTGFGASSFDADHDGHVDLFVTNGHLDDEPWIQTPMAQVPLFYRGLGLGKFQLIPEKTMPYLSRPTVGRGMASGDLNNDGFVDMVIVERDRPVRVLMNRTKNQNRWLGLDLKDRHGHSPVGAKVTVKKRDQKPQVRWVVAGTSYLSSHETRLVIGFGASEVPESVVVEVEWPGTGGQKSEKQNLSGIELGKYTTVKAK